MAKTFNAKGNTPLKRFALVLLILFVSMPLSAQTDDALPIDIPQVAQLGRGKANTLEWHPNGDVLAVGGSLGLWLYDDQFNELAYFPDMGEVAHLAWSPDGSQLATSDWDETLQIWDITLDPCTAELNRAWMIPKLSARFFWSPDGEKLAVSTTRSTDILNVATGEQIMRVYDVNYAFDWSPDSTKLAGATCIGEDSGQRIQVWDTATGEVINTYNAGEDFYYWSDIKWSPDGSTLVGTDGIPANLYIWDVETGELLHTATTISLDGSVIHGTWWLEGGSKLVTSDHRIYSPGTTSLMVWDVTEWTLDQDYVLYRTSGHTVKRPNRNEWTFLADSGQLINWELESDEILASRSVYSQPADILVWSPDSADLAASQRGLGPNIAVWDLADMSRPSSGKLPGSDLRLNTDELRWSDDGSQLIGSLKNGPAIAVYDLVVQWDIESGEPPETLNEWCCDFEPSYAWNSDFTQVASRDYSGEGVTISNVDHRPDGRIWAGDPLVQIDVENPVQMLWSPDGTMLAVLSKDDAGETSIWVYDAATGEIINTIMPFMTFFQSFTWSPDSSMLAVSGSRYIAAADTTEYRMVVIRIDPDVDVAWSFFNLAQFDTAFIPAWNPDSTMIAATTPEGIGVYDLDSIALVANNPEPDAIIPTETIYSLAWSPDGQWLAGGHEDGTVRIWDVSGFSD